MHDGHNIQFLNDTKQILLPLAHCKLGRCLFFKTAYSFGTCTRYMNNEGGFGHTNTVLAHDLPCLPHLSS